MDFAATCRSHAPALLCQHSDIALYLLPSAALALVIRYLAAAHPVFFVFTVAGTLCHELAHAVVGWLSGAAPASLTIIPRRKGRHWELGSVTLTRVRWYNAAPAALAPLVLIVIPLAVAWWRTRPGWRFEPADLLLALLLAPQFLSFWPSAIDWRIAARSWPYLFIITPLAWLAWRGTPQLFQNVM
ncbi:hypothetical protein KY495_22100 [Massilia sp. PAMC28688]|uniref:hypothetical protein n=1 Tax=Massilia sp. PAMC28688 TaxID=2861283 RepID=UPI001C6319FD|nr:hypothetical protein [Massilia sp. PAMC28688]QYF93334.1 hypothetical protein KY495_22100 [Massilia sp. PAMC28688]